MLKIALPSGRIREQVTKLLHKAGIHLDFGSNDRSLTPKVNGTNDLRFLVFRSKDAATLLKNGDVDAAFLGGDIIEEVGAGGCVETLLDTGADPVNLVIAGRDNFREEFVGNLYGPASSPQVIATKYPNLVRNWLAEKDRVERFTILPVEGSVEVFAHLNDDTLIADITASGETLRSNGLTPFETIRTSTTLFVANRERLRTEEVRSALEFVAYVLRGVIQAEEREMLSVNASLEVEEPVTAILKPAAMQSVDRTLAADGKSVSLRIAVLRKDKYRVLRAVMKAGGTDPVVQPITLLA